MAARRAGSDDRTSPEVADQAGLGDGARVLVLWNGGAERRWLGRDGSLTIGRSSECDVQVDDPSVSRKHALVLGGDPVRVQDLGSSNGVRVRGEPIEPGRPAPVGRGEVVELGSVVLVVQGTAASPPAAAPNATMSLRHLLDLVSKSDLSIIILGETGVGKNVAARWVHDHSPRASQPFVPLNCPAFPEALLEGELFGYERGAFTGAASAKTGLIESADGGTLLLDEIGELPLATQAKLLGVLESREVLRLGSVKPRRIDVRFLAATNRDLDALVQQERFRADLHFRLNGISVTVPPLRERVQEIPELARLFLERASTRAGRPTPALSEEAVAWLVRQPWPGNVRELRNAIDRANALCTSDTVRPEHFAAPTRPSECPPPRGAAIEPPKAPPPSGASLWGETQALERQRVLEALEHCGGNQTRAAKLLGISRRALIHRLELYDMPRPRKSRG